MKLKGMFRSSVSLKLFLILLPIMLVVLLSAGALIFLNAKSNMQLQVEQNLLIESKSLSYQLGELFKEKAEIPRMMSTDPRTVSYLKSVKANSDAITNKLYNEVLQNLKKIQATDSLLSLVYIVGLNNNFYIGHDGSVSKQDFIVKDRPWYPEASRSSDVSFSDPYIDLASGQLVISMMKAIKEGDNVIGYVAIDVNLSSIPEIMKTYKPADGGYAFLLGKTGETIYHPDKSQIMINNMKENNWLPGLSDHIDNSNNGVILTKENNASVYVAYAPIKDAGWKVGIIMPQSTALASVTSFTQDTILYLLVALIVVTIVIFVMLRYLLLPLKRMNHVISEFSAGNLKPRFIVKGQDEIAQVSENLNRMIDAFTIFLAEVRCTASGMRGSSTDLTAMTQLSLKAFYQIRESMKEVANSSEFQRESAVQTSNAMEEMAVGVQRLAEASGTVSEEAQASLERLHIEQNIVKSTVKHMSTVQFSVQETAREMEKLSEFSMGISEIVSIISNIANETRLLSLNASIEAARVGEQGKGFAVVAGEVKKLAEQSHNSSVLISEKVQTMLDTTMKAVNKMNESVKNVQEGREMVYHMGGAFENIQITFNKITDQITEISAVAEQMAAGTEEVSASMSSMTVSYLTTVKQSQMIKVASEDQNVVVRNISESADDLNRMAAELNQSLSNFEG
ncbi:methyl-accepting chemotaxis protein [Paenibacillus sp. LjRoot153]|uniref:methyl-accepting chemotaxis protein n=1 Tax=Paenibacillus sp. LjRoot153 TaxID=3342270 RepID=UPI003ED02D28